MKKLVNKIMFGCVIGVLSIGVMAADPPPNNSSGTCNYKLYNSSADELILRIMFNDKAYATKSVSAETKNSDGSSAPGVGSVSAPCGEPQSVEITNLSDGSTKCYVGMIVNYPQGYNFTYPQSGAWNSKGNCQIFD